MPKVIIDGIEYVPKGDIPPLTDERLQQCLEVLAEMRYFKQDHKMQGLAHNAIEALAPDLAKLDDKALYDRINGVEYDEL